MTGLHGKTLLILMSLLMVLLVCCGTSQTNPTAISESFTQALPEAQGTTARQLSSIKGNDMAGDYIKIPETPPKLINIHGRHAWRYQRTDSDTVLHFKFNSQEPANPTDRVTIFDYSDYANNVFDHRYAADEYPSYRHSGPWGFDGVMRINSVRTNAIISRWYPDFPPATAGLTNGFTFSVADSFVYSFVFFIPADATRGEGGDYALPSIQGHNFTAGRYPEINVTINDREEFPEWHGVSTSLRCGPDDLETQQAAWYFKIERDKWIQMVIVWDKTEEWPRLYWNGVLETLDYAVPKRNYDLGEFAFPTGIGDGPGASQPANLFRVAWSPNPAPSGGDQMAPMYYAEWWMSKGTKFWKVRPDTE